MTLYNFNKLELDEQLTIVWNKGVFVDNHFDIKERCNCYAIDMFFVEVVYDAEHNTITELRSFKNGHSLDKYSAKFQ
jgi:hypothetical protein